MNSRHLGLLALAAALVVSCSDSVSPGPEPPGGGSPTDTIWDVRVVAAYPHSTDAFTQGLIWVDTALVEGTGLSGGRSRLRRVDLATGATIQERATPDSAFGEGVTQVDDRVIQLTWLSRVAFVYDAAGFDSLGTFTYGTQGWGLTHDGSRFIMSDGSDTLYFRDLDTFATIGRVAVTFDGAPVERLNELELVDGRVYANVYQSDWIVIVDPASGRVEGRIDVGPLRARSGIPPGDLSRVPNGIAWDAAARRLFVTGKLWPELYHIELERRE